MPTHHADIELTAGDDWLIAGLLIDENGAPLDLSSVDMVQWIMLGADGMPVFTPGVALIEIDDDPTTGNVNISVPSLATKYVPPGRYVDAMRVVMSETSRSSVWQGIIGVDANPFDVFDSMVPVAFTVAAEYLTAPVEVGSGDMTTAFVPSDLAVDPDAVGAPSIGAAGLGVVVTQSTLGVGPESVGAPSLGAPTLG
jgi:hypothetical protein